MLYNGVLSNCCVLDTLEYLENFFFESINFYTLFLCVARQWRMVKECTVKSVTGGLWVFVFMRCCLGRHHFMLSLSLKPIAELCSTR